MVSSDPRGRAAARLWQTDPDRPGAFLPNLYCILDAARDPQIYPRLRALAASVPVMPLYQGAAAVEMAAVAPYLVYLGDRTEVFDWIFDAGWGRGWGIFVWSPQIADGLRAHFRKLTLVRTEQNARLWFRFYDPRVLRAFLPTCDAGQLREMFGSIQCLMAEDADGAALLSFRQRDGNLHAERFSLAAG